MQKETEFRLWLYKMWYDHKMEVEAYTSHFPDYLSSDYFKKYKWWLKREYKHRVKNQMQLRRDMS
jgi:hypothetical protein